ncbi:hypothetical protein L3X38_025496 [Prunus dulcis]|uniref:Uncharacterized protein n=1 Tax=Prunus dulcis TaxID=3755 RepID=A0AAD4Z822_PRUDU|nr:hypothetical protein L3X38_025496 [Prunus dulcis]
MGRVVVPSQRGSTGCFYCSQVGHFKSEFSLLSLGGTARQETGAQQEQGSRGQSQSQSGASSSAARSSSSSGVQSTFRGRGGRHQRGQSGYSTTQGRVFSKQEAQATPDVITYMIPVFGYFAHVLIDPIATHSFIASSFIPLLKKGCVGHLAHIIDTREVTLNLEDVPVVREFLDVIPDNFLGLPPRKKLSLPLNFFQARIQSTKHLIGWHQLNYES